MGVVFEARHEVVGRRFAVKVLRPSLSAQPEYLQRFRREAEAAGSLENEHIAAVVDFGMTPDGGAFLVMEYLEGEDVRARLQREGCIEVGRAVEIAVQAGRGLAAAHARGIVHRDLKPENLFVCRRPDGQELTKVLDFGIAKLQDPRTTASRTRTGLALGTAHYMSPEQARGERSVDHRSDIYALGAVLYELICGVKAHPGDSFIEVLYRVHSEAPVPLRERCAGVPEEVAQAVHRALAETPLQRFQSMEEFVQVLLPHAAGSPGGSVEAQLEQTKLGPPQVKQVEQVEQPGGRRAGTTRSGVERLSGAPVGVPMSGSPPGVATPVAARLGKSRVGAGAGSGYRVPPDLQTWSPWSPALGLESQAAVAESPVRDSGEGGETVAQEAVAQTGRRRWHWLTVPAVSLLVLGLWWYVQSAQPGRGGAAAAGHRVLPALENGLEHKATAATGGVASGKPAELHPAAVSTSASGTAEQGEQDRGEQDRGEQDRGEQDRGEQDVAVGAASADSTGPGDPLPMRRRKGAGSGHADGRAAEAPPPAPEAGRRRRRARRLAGELAASDPVVRNGRGSAEDSVVNGQGAGAETPPGQGAEPAAAVVGARGGATQDASAEASESPVEASDPSQRPRRSRL